MKKLIKTAILFLAGAMLMSGAACTKAETNPDDGKLKVVTVNFPPYDLVRQITNGDIIPEMLLAGGQDAHSYEPTAKDIIKINNADIFICTGGESDAWVDRIAESLDSDVMIVRMFDYTELIEEEHDEPEHSHRPDSDEIEYDEHVWTSPKNAVSICAGITEALCGCDPANAQKYRDGLTSYTAELNALSEELRQTADSITKPLIFGDRFPFAYMARDYGLTYFAAFAGCSSETEPSAAKMTELINKAREVDASVIYHIEFSTGKVASAIAESVGAEVRLLHSCHTLSDSDLAAGETYISIMRRNIKALRERG